MRPLAHSVLAGTVVAAGVLAAPSASAGVTIAVQTFLDGDQPQCSLRSAVRAANLDTSVVFCGHDGSPGTDTIVLQDGTYHLTVMGSDDEATAGDLDITGDVVIRGAGADRTIIDATGLGDRVFEVLSGGALTLTDLTVTGGSSACCNGGGIANEESLTLDHVTIRGNTAKNGGGVFHYGTASLLDIRNSAIVSNMAVPYSGGGIGINNPGATLTNVTVSGNAAQLDGGGVHVESTGGTMLHSVTIAGNRADGDDNGTGNGGGLSVSGSSGVTLQDSLLAGNADSSMGTVAPDCKVNPGALGTNDYNLVADTQNCGFPAGTANILDQDARLGPLGDNGGPTPTQALVAGSPAIDAGAGCSPSDQRGAPRSGSCDIGAYELVTCLKAVVNRVGTEGNDGLVGTNGPDGFLGLAGNDVLSGKVGKDRLCGGPGKDRLKGGGGKDRMDGGPGKDTCAGAGGRDRARACEVERGVP